MHDTPFASVTTSTAAGIAAVVPSTLLRRALLADACVSGATAALQLLAGASFAAATGLPLALLTGTGVFMVVYAALLLRTATRGRVWAWWLWVIVVGNVAWAVGSVELLAGDALRPTSVGEAFLILQAVATLTFATLEFGGFRASQRIGRAGL